MNTKVILFSDLDGTLLDKNYSYADLQPVIQKLRDLQVSLILNSSKTKAEVEFYLQKLHLQEPFIVENGSAILIPQGYFRMPYHATRQNHHYRIIELGTDYATIREKLALIKKKTHAKIKGFGDMTIKEVAEQANLSIELAGLSKNREYDEPFEITEGSEADIIQAIHEEGLAYTKGGRFLHLLGCTDKGKAVAVLKELYVREYHNIVSIGVGEGENDLPMLRLVDKPFLIDSEKNAVETWNKILEAAIAYTNLAR